MTNIFTDHKGLRRLCFYTCLSVILFTGRGVCLPQCMLGYTPPWEADIPREADIPPSQEADTLLQCMLGDTGDKRVVRILLECILVFTEFAEFVETFRKNSSAMVTFLLSVNRILCHITKSAIKPNFCHR